MIRRTHIVGGPGSGKTTLARRLAGALGCVAFDLDAVGYEGGAGPKRPLDIRLADVQQIAAQPAWVSEGVFLWWTDALLQRADLIVWLDLPWRVCAWRIVARHVRAELARANRHPGWRRLFSFLRWSWDYRCSGDAAPPSQIDDDSASCRAATRASLAPYRVKVVRCRRAEQVRAPMARLQQGQS